jgi:hypothetical protein
LFNWFGLSQPIQPIRPIKPIEQVFKLRTSEPLKEEGGNIVVNNVDLSIDFCGVKFKNPFLLIITGFQQRRDGGAII